MRVALLCTTLLVLFLARPAMGGSCHEIDAPIDVADLGGQSLSSPVGGHSAFYGLSLAASPKDVRVIAAELGFYTSTAFLLAV
jgi:hypothetical protein